jgi:hypothetical protein
MNCSAILRRKLITLAESYVENNHLEQHVYRSSGNPAVVLFRPYVVEGELRHGNFHQPSYAEIRKHTCWHQRLFKRHTKVRELQPQARELDSCTSSDALLMNIFCHPSIVENARVAQLFGFPAMPMPCFGFKARLPKKHGGTETPSTEVDMVLFGAVGQPPRWGKAFVESKLTEKDFTREPRSTVEQYRDFREVFNSNRLPVANGKYKHYQLIRNVLAAHYHNASFHLIYYDGRDDLLAAFGEVNEAVILNDLRGRCHAITWQKIAGVLGPSLRDFLRTKYGID